MGLLAGATISSCKRPIDNAISHLVPPTEITNGEAIHYATTYYRQNHYGSILAKVVDNRPIKIEGNNLSPISQGGTTAKIQASILDLYNSKRLKHPTILGEKATWQEVIETLKLQLEWQKKNSKETLLLSHTIVSPAMQAIINKLQIYYPNLRVAYYDEQSKEAMLTANQQQFGRRTLPQYLFDKAKIIVAFNCDFLSGWLSPIEHTKAYSKVHTLRDGNRQISTHIQLETQLTATGAKADLRHTITTEEEIILLRQIWQYISDSTSSEEVSHLVPRITEKLLKNRGESVLISGTNRLENQLLVNAINQQLNNYGNTISFKTECHLYNGNDKQIYNEFIRLKNGKTTGIILLDCDPVYELSCETEAIIRAAKFSVALSITSTQSTDACNIVCPTHHYLEAWGDAMPYDGLYSLQQPVISPLFDSQQIEELLLNLMNESDYPEFLKSEWQKRLKVTDKIEFIELWSKLLQDGIYQEDLINKKIKTVYKKVEIPSKSNDKKEIVVVENPFIGSGESANNKWLHELPHPISKIAWDNYAIISAKKAKKQGWREGDLISINGHESLPVVILPATADDTLTIFYGYGRGNNTTTKCGVSIRNKVTSLENILERDNFFTLKSAIKTGENYLLAKSQTNDRATEFNPIQTYRQSEKKITKVEENKSLYPAQIFPQHHWAMAIDLQACIGCNTCVVACQAENNIPVVGKTEMARHHEMHWIRMDRYFEGEGDHLKVDFQPVMCQHCDSAPCENVCPVGATTHSIEGINQMIYARCIGTRYCNNNCPYKARTFNWFDYTGTTFFRSKTPHNELKDDSISRMVLNPNVTVRSKGVIEKCSFCIQRIVEKKNKARLTNTPIADGDIQTACMQSCPADAIVFGDLNDANSKVSKLLKSDLSYHLLNHLGTKPSVFYLKKIIS